MDDPRDMLKLRCRQMDFADYFQQEGQGTGQPDKGIRKALKDTGAGQDPLYPHARRAVIREQRASVGMLQRIFRISFYRAESLMKELEASGVIGPEVMGKYRKVLKEDK